MSKAEIVCKECGHKEKVEIPQNSCLAFHKCGKCEGLISVPEGSKNCCVICEYSDKKCSTEYRVDREKIKDLASSGCACCR